MPASPPLKQMMTGSSFGSLSGQNPYGVNGPRIQNGLDAWSPAYGPGLRQLQDAIAISSGQQSSFSPQSVTGQSQAILSQMSPQQAQGQASRWYENGPNGIFDMRNNKPMPSGAELVNRWMNPDFSKPAQGVAIPNPPSTPFFSPGRAQSNYGRPTERPSPLRSQMTGQPGAAPQQAPQQQMSVTQASPQGQMGSLYAQPQGQGIANQIDPMMLGRIIGNLFKP